MPTHADVPAFDARRRMGVTKLMVLALCIGFGLAFVIANVRSWELEDANAYWNAAVRLQPASRCTWRFIRMPMR